MIKTITMFKKVKDLESLLNYYINDILPILHSIPGVLYTDIVKVQEMSSDCPEDIEGIQVIMETFFESQEAVAKMLESPSGMAIMKKIEATPFEREQYVYLGQLRRFEANRYRLKK